jgi:hypothetical protein
MPNAYIPRLQVHAWSDAIGLQPPTEQAALTRLLKQQRRLTRWIEENGENLTPITANVGVYLFGVLARIFDLGGGRLRAVTWEQIRDAERRVGAAVAELMPADDGFPARARAVAWRAQPHVLDEALYALFERPRKGDEEQDLDLAESVKVYLMMWVATEALDASWTPPAGFAGETSYAFTPIEG